MSRFKSWLKERVPTAGFDYQVPSHANTLAFTLGGITLISFIILMISGIILAQFYSPTPENANQSIRILMTENNLGNFIRGLHYWAAQVAIVTVILHLLRIFFYGSYKRPREVNWLLGVILFLGTVGLYYTGTILKWDQEAYEALEHAAAGAKIVGGFAADYFVENPAVTLLSKFFSLHTSLLPILVIAVLAVHLILVKALGISPLPFKSKKNSGKSTFLVHLKHLLAYGLITLAVISIFATLFPPSLGTAPVEGIEATKPPWIFMSIFTIENWFGLIGLIITALILVVALLLVPFIDRKDSASPQDRKGIVAVGVIAVLLFVAFTVNAYFTKPEQHIEMGDEEQQQDMEEIVDNNDEQTDEDQIDNDQIDDVDQSTEESVELKALNQALSLVVEIDKILDEKGDIKLAGEKAAELDEVVDAIGDQIKAKDAKLRQELGDIIHELGELQEAESPDLAKASDEAHEAEEKIKEAIKLFEESAELKALNQALSLVVEIDKILDEKGDFKLAGEKAAELDEVIDAIGDQIEAKDTKLRQELGEIIHELGELQEAKNPDLEKASNDVHEAEEKIKAAIKLFE